MKQNSESWKELEGDLFELKNEIDKENSVYVEGGNSTFSSLESEWLNYFVRDYIDLD